MYFGHGVFEAGVVPGFVFERKTVWSGHSTMAVEHGFVGVYGDGRVNGLGVFAWPCRWRHEVRQFASAVNDAFDADLIALGSAVQSTLYTGTSGCPFSCASWLMAWRERHDGRHMRVVVDDVRVLREVVAVLAPAAVTMVFAHTSSLRSMAVLRLQST